MKNVNIEQIPAEETFSFLIETNDTGFKKPYYTCNYKGQAVKKLNLKGFDLDLLEEISLDVVKPKVEYYKCPMG